MKLLRRRVRAFDIQVQDLTLHITAPEDFAEESRASALSFWEQLQSYGARDPEFRTSKRALTRVASDAPPIVQEVVSAASAAGVGPMFCFRGAVVDAVGRFLGEQMHDVTVACDGDYFLKAKKRMKVAVKRHGGDPITIVLQPSAGGTGLSTTLEARAGRGRPRRLAVDRSAVMDYYRACDLLVFPSHSDGFGMALHYLRRVPGDVGGVVVIGERIGVAGGVEIAG